MGGAWEAQSVKHLTLDFSSGHDLMVREIELHIRLRAVSMEPAWDSLPLSLSLPCTSAFSLCLSLLLSLSLKINKLKKKKQRKENYCSKNVSRGVPWWPSRLSI